MSRERLSRLQRWILQRCADKGCITRHEARRFFGKVFSPNGRSPQNPSGYVWFDDPETEYGQEYIDNYLKRRMESMLSLGSTDEKDYRPRSRGSKTKYPKQELRSTRSIEASISRSITLLWKRGLIEFKREVKSIGTATYYHCYIYLTDKGKLKVNGVAPDDSVNDKEVAHAEATRESVTVNSGATCPDVNLYSGEPVEVGA